MKVDLENKQAAQYIEAVDYQLLCPRPIKKDILSKLKNSVAEYVDEHPQASADELEFCFGNPKVIADEYIASLDQDEVRKSLRKSRYVKRTILLVAGVIILAVIITSATVIIWNAVKKTEIIYENAGVLDISTIEEMG